MNTAPQEDLFEQVLPTDQQEEESDLEGRQINFRDAVMHTADWTVGTLYSQLQKGTINLDPGFQRRHAWDDVRKSRLIESLIAGLPIPNIVLAENSEHRGRFLVIDGKQRLLTIQDFLDNKLALKGLDLRQDLENLTFDSLPADDRDFLENNSIRSTLIKNTPDADFLYVLFFRLNSGSLQLSPQELRRALIGGKTLTQIDKYIEGSKFFAQVFGPGLDRRMRDSELVLRFIAFDRAYEAYDGDLKKFLDSTVDHFEKGGAAAEKELFGLFEKLECALSATIDIFAKDAFKKYTGEKYERRINRAVFDVITRFFADEKISNLARQNSAAVVAEFKATCGIVEFRSAVEKTTKSNEATKNRIDIWGGRLAAILGMTYDAKAARIQ
ncbi:DUF262 domain-containing protein [Herbaspirillum rubrisubalbicans Os34]|uniref:DUF262 domain-containing protein n=1 Tax=Herbaspirillum rubrisubalbicans Os34 TaxID=1235827 RepID=A0A6M3ZUI8_9BURK|nr:DUF262 domain-containing protein [Herbaspirillum rubrisubalbicans]QJQ02324.1 DUF262 domain-containing protein [Herbaspirillum rubrisubalbicans Os34]